MPESDAVIRAKAVDRIRSLGAFSCILDVGTGSGFYGKALRIVYPFAHLIGIEAHEPYLKRFDLQSVYDEVVCKDANDVDLAALEPRPDLAVFADVLEHMTPRQALWLVHSAKQVAGTIIATVPIVPWPQGAVNGNPWEEHRHQWYAMSFMDQFGMNLIDHSSVCGLFEWRK